METLRSQPRFRVLLATGALGTFVLAIVFAQRSVSAGDVATAQILTSTTSSAPIVSSSRAGTIDTAALLNAINGYVNQTQNTASQLDSIALQLKTQVVDPLVAMALTSKQVEAANQQRIEAMISTVNTVLQRDHLMQCIRDLEHCLTSVQDAEVECVEQAQESGAPVTVDDCWIRAREAGSRCQQDYQACLATESDQTTTLKQ